MTPYINTSSLGIARPKIKELFDFVPEEVIVDLSCKLYSLCNLTWGYVDTILDLCVSMRLSETKQLVRTVREVKRKYDKFRARVLDRENVEKETMRGEQIEDKLDLDFQKLFYSLYNDISKLKLTDDHRRLVIAVQQAMTLLDAVKIFSKHCDKVVESYTHIPHMPDCMLEDYFKPLYYLVPQFAGDCYNPDVAGRKLTAGIIVNGLHKFRVVKTSEEEEEIS